MPDPRQEALNLLTLRTAAMFARRDPGCLLFLTQPEFPTDAAALARPGAAERAMDVGRELAALRGEIESLAAQTPRVLPGL